MKKITLIIVTLFLITSVSGAYGYFFIYQSDDSDEVEVQQEQVQETNETVEEEPEEFVVHENDVYFVVNYGNVFVGSSSVGLYWFDLRHH